MPRKGNTSIALPDEVYDGLTVYIKRHPELGYTGVPELVREELRKILRQGKRLVEVPAR